ncbi:hypothetical protein [Pseudomonas sp. v388]|uniref:hypothetical protein n=1 Tax=Pseudomonas sp. v388 TaxID=2479849 RepID=UPI00211411DC|nr:hypothetical protein [Pseudomonas sp. v388]
MNSLDKNSAPRTNRKAGPVKSRPTAVRRDKKDPHSALRAPIRPERYREKRTLTAEQRKNPLLRMAFARLSQAPELRGQYLRALDTLHGSRRTRSEKFDALAKTCEQILLRLDLATGVLGWLDVERGEYFLNTQCGIAEDSGVSAPAFNRLIHSLETVGYAYRRIERVRLDEKDAAGLNLVRTRVLIRLTEQFFADLGLRYLWYRAKKAANKKREKELRQVGDIRMARQERASLEQLRREKSRRNWENSEARKAAQNDLPAPASPSEISRGPEPPRQHDRGAVKPSALMDRLLTKIGKTPPLS